MLYLCSDIIASYGVLMQSIDGDFLDCDYVTNGGEYNHDDVDCIDEETQNNCIPTTHSSDTPITILDNTSGKRNMINVHVIQH